jgi:hypothetical protein
MRMTRRRKQSRAEQSRCRVWNVREGDERRSRRRRPASGGSVKYGEMRGEDEKSWEGAS